MSVSVQAEDFDPGAEIASLSAGRTDVGAVASFIGRVRGEGISDMTLEHYPGMTEKALAEILIQAQARWPLLGARVIHRVGQLRPGEQIVLVAVAASHRGEAFQAAEFIMDYLKTQAPFWKKETTPEGGRWVDARESDDAAHARWAEGSVPPIVEAPAPAAPLPMLEEAIVRQRRILKGWLETQLSQLAGECLSVWGDGPALEARLAQGMVDLPYCKYLYVLNAEARQLTATVSRGGFLENQRGRDRSERPYLAEALRGSPFSLSDAYISRNARRPSLTAVQRIEDGQGRLLGYLGADFDLRELPGTQAQYRQPGQWMQLKGDPAIRSGLFYQERVTSPMDEQLGLVMDQLAELIAVHGVFHAKLHFSSSRATLWTLEDPYRFRIHGIQDLVNPSLCLAFPRHPYPADAHIPAEAIRPILDCFRRLRFMDETIYLRSGMFNIFNGFVGLTFSCDGSHYMPWREFLDKDMAFWLGTPAAPCGAPESACTG